MFYILSSVAFQVTNDLQHVEAALAKKAGSSGELYLVGNSLTLADIML